MANVQCLCMECMFSWDGKYEIRYCSAKKPCCCCGSGTKCSCDIFIWTKQSVIGTIAVVQHWIRFPVEYIYGILSLVIPGNLGEQRKYWFARTLIILRALGDGGARRSITLNYYALEEFVLTSVCHLLPNKPNSMRWNISVGARTQSNRHSFTLPPPPLRACSLSHCHQMRVKDKRDWPADTAYCHIHFIDAICTR